MNIFEKFPVCFLAGVAGCFSTCIIQPQDVLKVRIQNIGQNKKINMINVFKELKIYNFKSYYNGLDIAIIRQLSYGQVKFGIFNYLINKDDDLKIRVIKGTLSGSIAGIFSTPLEILLIQKQLSNKYLNSYKLLSKIKLDNNFFNVFKSTLLRCAIVNSVGLSSYTFIKNKFLNQEYPRHKAIICSSLIAGLSESIAGTPIDLIKTRITISNKKTNNILQIAKNIYKQEGFCAFYRSFFPFYFRSGIHSSLTLIFLELMTTEFC